MATHLSPWGFVGTLEFIHLVGYLYETAQIGVGPGEEPRAAYERRLRWAWGGEVEAVRAESKRVAERLGVPPPDAKDTAPRKVAAETWGDVTNARDKTNDAEYRRRGLPISGAPVGRAREPLNRRVRGTEKFWVSGGAESMLQVRAAIPSEDGRVERYANRRRPQGTCRGRQSARTTEVRTTTGLHP